jgi:hypothetical protein
VNPIFYPLNILLLVYITNSVEWMRNKAITAWSLRVFGDVAPSSQVDFDSSPWCWRHFERINCRSASNLLHGAKSQKTLNFILAAMRTWNLTVATCWKCLAALMLHVHSASFQSRLQLWGCVCICFCQSHHVNTAAWIEKNSHGKYDRLNFEASCYLHKMSAHTSAWANLDHVHMSETSSDFLMPA